MKVQREDGEDVITSSWIDFCLNSCKHPRKFTRMNSTIDMTLYYFLANQRRRRSGDVITFSQIITFTCTAADVLSAFIPINFLNLSGQWMYVETSI
jgi:hypothetical protein